jgi:hypothetical protein
VITTRSTPLRSGESYLDQPSRDVPSIASGHIEEIFLIAVPVFSIFVGDRDITFSMNPAAAYGVFVCGKVPTCGVPYCFWRLP